VSKEFIRRKPFHCLQNCKALITDEENKDDNCDVGHEFLLGKLDQSWYLDDKLDVDEGCDSA